MIFYRVEGDEAYIAEDGSIVQREHGETPAGNPLHGRWVYRNSMGEFVDYSQWRNDLEERNKIQLIGCA